MDTILADFKTKIPINCSGTSQYLEHYWRKYSQRVELITFFFFYENSTWPVINKKTMIITVINKMIAMSKDDVKVVFAHNHLAGNMTMFIFDTEQTEQL